MRIYVIEHKRLRYLLCCHDRCELPADDQFTSRDPSNGVLWSYCSAEHLMAGPVPQESLGIVGVWS